MSDSDSGSTSSSSEDRKPPARKKMKKQPSKKNEIKAKVRKVYEGKITGKEFTKIFKDTLLPKFVDETLPDGEVVVMPYNLYVNRHKLNKDVIEVKEHFYAKHHSNNYTCWMFVVLMKDDTIKVWNTNEMIEHDKIRLIHYLNQTGLAENHKIFDWARNNLEYVLPVVHEKVKKVKLMEEIAEKKRICLEYEIIARCEDKLGVENPDERSVLEWVEKEKDVLEIEE